MKHCIARFLQIMVVFFLGVSSPAVAAKSDQTHLSRLVKTKHLLIVKATERLDRMRPAKMAQIRAYEAALDDIQKRAHQLKFLIAVSESNPFEVRMYFRQAAELEDEFADEIQQIRSLARKIQINLSIVESGREDLRFILQAPVSADQKRDAQSLLDNLVQLEATELAIKKELDAVLARYVTAEKEGARYAKGLEEEMAGVWTVYFTQPLFILFKRDILRDLSLSYFIWANSIRAALQSKLPDSTAEWVQSALAFLVMGFASLLVFRWILVRIVSRSHTDQDGWTRFLRAFSLYIFLCGGFWAASMVNVFPGNIAFSRLAVIFGAAAAILLAWRLREIKLQSGLSSPLFPLFYLYVAGIMAQLTNMPLLLLGVVWPLAVGIMMLFMWRISRKHTNEIPRRLARFCFWSGIPIIGLSLTGFTFPAAEIFLTLFLCCILYQFALAVSDLIRGRLARLQDKGDSLFHSVSISLVIPLIWFLSAGFILIWLADQFGQARILDLADKMTFTWKDVHIGFGQIVVAVALFFMAKPVVEVLKRAVDGMGRRSQVDQTAIAPLKTVLGYGVWGLYGLVLLHIIGVSLSSIVLLAGGMSVGIGFGLQHIINNFVSGLILVFGRSVRPGDVIEHERVLGVVEKVTIRNTLVRTRDDTTILIPNSNLVAMPFVNMSRSNNRAVRLIVAVGAGYNSDPELVKRLLLEAAAEHPEVLRHPAPRVRFEDFGDSHLDFRIKFWVEFDGSKRVASDLRFAILKKFRDHGVEMAFPQLDLHLKGFPQTCGAISP
ncbi:MAG: mechanosensitive ion channel domain-containing protein [Pseudomonadota bacterium]